MSVEWTSSLAVGVAPIDAQHRELFRMARELTEAVEAGRADTEIDRVLEFIERYVHIHFALEERVMNSRRYPGYDQHKAEHEAFLGETQAFRRRLATGASRRDIALALSARLTTWLTAHISQTDRALGVFLNGLPRDGVR